MTKDGLKPMMMCDIHERGRSPHCCVDFEENLPSLLPLFSESRMRKISESSSVVVYCALPRSPLRIPLNTDDSLGRREGRLILKPPQKPETQDERRRTCIARTLESSYKLHNPNGTSLYPPINGPSNRCRTPKITCVLLLVYRISGYLWRYIFEHALQNIGDQNGSFKSLLTRQNIVDIRPRVSERKRLEGRNMCSKYQLFKLFYA